MAVSVEGWSASLRAGKMQRQDRSDRRRRVSMCYPDRESGSRDSMETCILDGLLGSNMDSPAAQEMAVVQDSTSLQGEGAHLEDSRQDIDRCRRSPKW